MSNLLLADTGMHPAKYRPLEPLLPVDAAAFSGQFRTLFGQAADCVAFAPTRVNLMGEHTDYNDGFVLPIAMNTGTYTAAALRSDNLIAVRSLNAPAGESGEITFHLDGMGPLADSNAGWANYVKGMIQSVAETFALPMPGMNLLIQSDGLVGSGLSSSAALELSVGMAALQTARLHAGQDAEPITDADKLQLALAGQSAEHVYAGVQCGIMDQMASALCQADHALMLDCRQEANGAYRIRQVPIHLREAVFLVIDTRLIRGLKDTAYNDRKAQCAEAVRMFQGKASIQALRDVSPEALQNIFSDILGELPEALRRARHVVSENARVLASVQALEAGDAQAFGQLLNQSHDSLRTDYEVSCKQLDTLVDTARKSPYVYGARMTGAGFGGCAVALVQKDHAADVKQAVTAAYELAYQATPAFYETEACQGARLLA